MSIKTLEEACLRKYKEGDGYAATQERLEHVPSETVAAMPEVTADELRFARKYIRHHGKFEGMSDMSEEIS